MRFGRPRIGFLVTAGVIDSMVNHYTAAKKPRSSDAYSPGGKAGCRPDRATIVYCNRIREAYGDIPIAIGGVEASGGIALMAKWILNVTDGSQNAAAMLILWASGIISGIIDNIPYTATMAPMLAEIRNVMGVEYTLPLWWCLSLGACLGGNLTIIGAAANVIVSETSAHKGHPIGFIQFMKYGILIVFISLLFSSVYVWFKYLAN